MATPEQNVRAHATVTEVACPHCGQGVGQACVTNAHAPWRQQNEATFPHMLRVRARLAQMAGEAMA